jgi:hypothetical protein
MNTIRCFELVNGRVIITELVDNYWLNPLYIRVDAQTKGIVVAPVSIIGDVSKITPIDKRHILFEYAPVKQLIDTYRNTVRHMLAEQSGITIASPNAVYNLDKSMRNKGKSNAY